MSDRRNATNAYRWNERLRKRVEAGVTNMDKDAAFLPYLGAPSIREETRTLLSTPAQAPFSTAAAGVQVVFILLLVYSIITQIITIIGTQDSPYIKNR